MYADNAGKCMTKTNDHIFENLTSFQRRFAIEACDVLYELVAWWLLRELAAKGVCGRV